MPGRKRPHLVDYGDEVFRLGGEHDFPARRIAVKQRTDADGVARGDEAAPLAVINDHGKFRVQPAEHIQPVFPVKREYDFAVAVTREGVAFPFQLPLHGAEAVELAVADDSVAVHEKGLHTLLVEPHYGEPLEADYTPAEPHRSLVVGSSRRRRGKRLCKNFIGHIVARIDHYRTHDSPLRRAPRRTGLCHAAFTAARRLLIKTNS